MARATGLEPATSGVTGRHSNQLSYARIHSLPGVPGEAAGLREGDNACQATLALAMQENARPKPGLKHHSFSKAGLMAKISGKLVFQPVYFFAPASETAQINPDESVPRSSMPAGMS
ncbi:MAG: hypothetical protein FD175_974 [Beijerinckiaceae bacterium]|nr:MAG: hypothetical protein FD175_974 [Beijerinckiaceae bacterium]